jgi:hypothetical protein
MCVFCSVSFVSGPAHILCLTVASGWNKELFIPAIEVIVTLIAATSILLEMFDSWGFHLYGYVQIG